MSNHSDDLRMAERQPNRYRGELRAVRDGGHRWIGRCRGCNAGVRVDGTAMEDVKGDTLVLGSDGLAYTTRATAGAEGRTTAAGRRPARPSCRRIAATPTDPERPADPGEPVVMTKARSSKWLSADDIATQPIHYTTIAQDVASDVAARVERASRERAAAADPRIAALHEAMRRADQR